MTVLPILVESKVHCTGCTACCEICQSAAIEMIADAEGFLYPTINEALCVGCFMCVKVCPVRKREELKNVD